MGYSILLFSSFSTMFASEFMVIPLINLIKRTPPPPPKKKNKKTPQTTKTQNEMGFIIPWLFIICRNIEYFSYIFCVVISTLAD